MDGPGACGNGADCLEPNGTGSIKSAAWSAAEAFNADRSGPAITTVRPPGTLAVAAHQEAGRPCGGPRITGTPIGPQAGPRFGTEDSGPGRAAVCGLRSHVSSRTPSLLSFGIYSEWCSCPGDSNHRSSPFNVWLSDLPGVGTEKKRSFLIASTFLKVP